jgi:plastocyanin
MRRSIAAAALVMVLVGAAPASSAVVVRGKLTDAGYRWRPKVVDIATGTKVTWKAVSGTHNVTSTSKNWSKSTSIGAGQTTSFTFQNAGTYRYRCTLHSTLSNGKCSGMCGKVLVG